jgi:hypothetical protein
VGANGTANTALVTAGTALTASGATDNTWYSLQGLFNNASSAINVNGSDATGSANAGAFSAVAFRLCRAGSTQLNGKIAEAGMWAATSNATDRGNLSTNQHSAANGYNF